MDYANKRKPKNTIHMIEAKLLTRTGEYVTTVLIPPMNPAPEILQWGARFFTQVDNGPKPGLVYKEAFCCYAVAQATTQP
jgi:hypothetical protein